MGSIDKELTLNLGGVAKLYFIETRHVSQLPAYSGMSYTGDISLTSGQNWNAIAFTLQTAKAALQLKPSVHGDYYHLQLTGRHPGDSESKQLSFDSIAEVLLAYRDQNGKLKVAGSLEAPVRMSFKHDTASQTKGANAYTFEFRYQGLLPPLFYSGSLTSEVTFTHAVLTSNGNPLLTSDGKYLQYN